MCGTIRRHAGEAGGLPPRPHAQCPRFPSDLASYLSHHPQRPQKLVYCVDYRGRGGSQYDRDWHNYTPFIELIDALEFMTLQDLHEAAIIGTSRAAASLPSTMAAVRPTAMGVVVLVLNDIGPVMETTGLARIMGYVGRTTSSAQLGGRRPPAPRDE